MRGSRNRGKQNRWQPRSSSIPSSLSTHPYFSSAHVLLFIRDLLKYELLPFPPELEKTAEVLQLLVTRPPTRINNIGVGWRSSQHTTPIDQTQNSGQDSLSSLLRHTTSPPPVPNVVLEKTPTSHKPLLVRLNAPHPHPTHVAAGLDFTHPSPKKRNKKKLRDRAKHTKNRNAIHQAEVLRRGVHESPSRKKRRKKNVDTPQQSSPYSEPQPPTPIYCIVATNPVREQNQGTYPPRYQMRPNICDST